MALDHDRFSDIKNDIENALEDSHLDSDRYEQILDEAVTRLQIVEEVDESRPPRLYVFGRTGAGKSSLINALANKEVAEVGDFKPTTDGSKVHEINFPDRYANWQVVDSRGLFESVSPEGEVPADTVELMKQDLKEYQPDMLLHVMTPDHVRAGKEDFEAVDTLRSELGSLFPPVVYCLNKVDTHLDPNGDWPPETNPSLIEDIDSNLNFVTEVLEETERQPFDRDNPYLGYEYDSEEHVGVVPLYLKEEPYWNVETLSWLMGDFLPDDARLQFFQAQRRDEIMRQWARKKTDQAALGAAGVGFTPLPVADFFVLTVLQLLLVAVIGAASCREIKWATVADYLSAMGGSALTGLGARGLARSLVQVVPYGGTAISTSVAYSTTWAIGRSAEEYFFNDKIVKPSEFRDDGEDRFDGDDE